MEFLIEYGLFFAKAVTILVVIAVVLALIANSKHKVSGHNKGHIEVKKLNETYDEYTDTLKEVVFEEGVLKQQQKDERKQEKLEQKAKKKAKDQSDTARRKRVFVVNFDGDIKASANGSLREEITAILGLAEPQDEVVVNLESGGGMVHGYGLAASQLTRITEKNIPLTVCVDKVAASGGYMMACVANKIVAAPFAIVGSIGVVAQVPNFHRLLKKNDVDFELYTAGEFKRTVTMFGENTDKGRAKFLEDIEQTHDLFKDYVHEHRPIVDITKVATGEVWYGRRALDEKLIDELKTSDGYLLEQAANADIFSVEFTHKKSLPEKLGLTAESTVDRLALRWLGRMQSHRWF